MVGPIPPSSPYSSSSFSDEPNPSIVKAKLYELEEELRKDMGPPPSEEALEKLLPEIQKFLSNNKALIFKLMEENGYPKKGPFSITAEFNSTISAIKNYLYHPNSGSLDLINESITQINYYLTHHYHSSY